MRVYVGVDGGGTNTDAAIISETGEILARLSGGPTNPHSVSTEQAISELQRVLEQLFNLISDLSTSCEGICLGMSGVDTIQERQLIAKTVNNYMKSRNRQSSEGCPVWVVSEGEIALMASLGHTHGVLCISGTGSIVYGFTREGGDTVQEAGVTCSEMKGAAIVLGSVHSKWLCRVMTVFFLQPV